MSSYLDTVLEDLKARGERITVQRRIVLEALCNQKDHLSINDIDRYLRKKYPDQDLSDVTIYRIVNWLRELELVSQTETVGAPTVYELLRRPHHHLICTTCGAVQEMDDADVAPLRARILDHYGFRARIDHLAVYGQCATCAGA
jgi:Fur family ferric uptake transcriptional regulator